MGSRSSSAAVRGLTASSPSRSKVPASTSFHSEPRAASPGPPSAPARSGEAFVDARHGRSAPGPYPRLNGSGRGRRAHDLLDSLVRSWGHGPRRDRRRTRAPSRQGLSAVAVASSARTINRRRCAVPLTPSSPTDARGPATWASRPMSSLAPPAGNWPRFAGAVVVVLPGDAGETP